MEKNSPRPPTVEQLQAQLELTRIQLVTLRGRFAALLEEKEELDAALERKTRLLSELFRARTVAEEERAGDLDQASLSPQARAIGWRFLRRLWPAWASKHDLTA